jgi:hypothetical protein
MIDYAVAVAQDPAHGYSQQRRWPSQGTDYDCSSLMYCAAQLGGGYDVPRGAKTCSGYTGTMLADFTAAGFTWVPWREVGEIPTGAVLLNTSQHTELYIGGDRSVGAHIDELGGVTGATPGDQTGSEISVTAYYVPSCGWDGILVPPQDGAGSHAGAPPAPNEGLDGIAREVIGGIWGNGAERVRRLADAGWDAAAVQERVNAIISKGATSAAGAGGGIDDAARRVMRGEFGNGAGRIVALEGAGYDAAAVQRRVNELIG